MSMTEILKFIGDILADCDKEVKIPKTILIQILLKYIEAECIKRSMCYYDNRQRYFNCYNGSTKCYFLLG